MATAADGAMAASLVGLLLAFAVLLLIVRAARQFRSYPVLVPASPFAGQEEGRVVAIVPARNEADVIDRCVGGLLAQDYNAMRVIVVDDGSTDGTAERVARYADGVRLRLIAAGPLPPGWTGKTHACWRGVQEAGDADFFCFVDADAGPYPALVRSALAEARRENLAFLSLEPFQELGTVWERLIIPAGFFALAFLRRFGAGEPAANGQFLLIRADAYARIGGHGAVRAAISEDSALARLAARAGCRVAVMGGERLIRARMYRSFPALWQGLAKNSTEALGGARAVIGVALLGVPLAWALVLAPPILALTMPAHTGALALAGLGLATLALAAALALHVSGARHFGIPAWYGLFFPIAYTLAAALALDGLRRSAAGTVAWKGREYRTQSQ
jgi:chlorobactene glucosyltransferase